uniref:Tumor necrosis factor receptor-related factor 7 n=1 Tax=Argopecten irradians TaxID=31199 RepID=A0AAU6MX40_ARGIR
MASYNVFNEGPDPNRSIDNNYVETTFGTANSLSPITTITSSVETDKYDSAISQGASRGVSSPTFQRSDTLLVVPHQHKRTNSNVSRISALSSAEEEEITVFVEPPNKKLYCRLCQTVFKEPVIVACGHTYCHRCVTANPEAACPVDGKSLDIIVANITLSEQIGDLFIHCKYGCSLSLDGLGYVVDSNKCPVQCRITNRSEHEDNCDFMPMECPNNSGCPAILKKDLEDHLKTCNRARCTHQRFGCEFMGVHDELDEHLKVCKFEGMKEYIHRTEEKMSDMQYSLNQKDQDVGFLRSMLGKLAERLENMEKQTEDRVEHLEHRLGDVVEELVSVKRDNTLLQDDLEQVKNVLSSRSLPYAPYDPLQMFKCRGTFVGHQGPVWCLCVNNDFLFSGSSDKTIKVWDTGNNYKCLKTLEGHTGIVLAICTYGNKLYSGSQDSNIIVWNIDNFEQVTVIDAHCNPVCTLASTKSLLFSGSLKVIKVWDVHTNELKQELTGLNHWVRALVATQNHLYSGSYQTIRIWDLETLECLQMLETSGGSVYSIAITNYHILCGTYENVIHVWELESKNQIVTLKGHTGTVYALAELQTSSGTKIFSASYDRSLRVWSMDNMICTQTLLRHQGSVACLAQSRGRIFSGAVDSTVKVWQ